MNKFQIRAIKATLLAISSAILLGYLLSPSNKVESIDSLLPENAIVFNYQYHNHRVVVKYKLNERCYILVNTPSNVTKTYDSICSIKND